MFQCLGYGSLDALTGSVIPDSTKGGSVFDLSTGMGGAEASTSLKVIVAYSCVLRPSIGQGYYNYYAPAPILRNLLENPA